MNDLYIASGGSNTTSPLYDLYYWGPITTQIGTSLGVALTALAIDPTTGTIYGVTSNNSVNPKRLVTVNPSTGVATIIGNLGIGFTDIDFDSIGQLYGVTNNSVAGNAQLKKINKATAAVTAVGVMAFLPPTGLAIRKSDDAAFVFNNGDDFYSLNLTTAATTALGIGTGSLSSAPTALAFDSTNTLLWCLCVGSRIILVDLSNGKYREAVFGLSSTIDQGDAMVWSGHQVEPLPTSGVSWNYDGSGSVTVTIHNSVDGRSYTAIAFIGSGPQVWGTGNGGDLVLVLSPVTGTAGELFEVEVDDLFLGYQIDGTVFEVGAASTVGHPFAITWSYDGVNAFEADFVAPITGHNYNLVIQYLASSGSQMAEAWSEQVTVTGSPATVLGRTLTNVPDSGTLICLRIVDLDAGSSGEYGRRVFIAGTAGSGRPGTAEPAPGIVSASDVGATISSSITRSIHRSLADFLIVGDALGRTYFRSVSDTGATVTDAIGFGRFRAVGDVGAAVGSTLARTVRWDRRLIDRGALVADAVRFTNPQPFTPSVVPDAQIELSGTSADLLGDLQPELAEASAVQGTLLPLADELARVEATAYSLLDSMFAQNASDQFLTLRMWEKLLGLPVGGVLGAEEWERLAIVTAVVRSRGSSGAAWGEILTGVLGGSGWTATPGPGPYELTLSVSPGSVYTAGQVLAVARRVTPAHLRLLTA